MSPWTCTLTADELEAHYTLTASIDPSFAKRERTFWESRTEGQLRALAAQAWNTNDSDQYQIARTYLAMREEHRAAA